MYRRRRWLIVVAAVVLVGTVEALSDTAFDAFLPFPFHTLLVLGVVSAVVGSGAWFAFRRIDRLTSDLEDRNAALESRNAVLRAVYDVSLAVSGRADPEQTIASIVANARSLLRVEGALLALDGPDGEFHLRAATAAPGVLSGDRLGRVGVAERAEDDLGCYLQDGYEIRLSAPVGQGGRRVGVLGLAIRSGAGRRFDQADVETMSALATQVGLALEAARLQDELQHLAVQGERERIAREMHDGLAQMPAYVNTKSQAIEALLLEGRVDEARLHLSQLAAAARSVYVDVREAILSLSTPVPADRGVAAALEEYAALFAESSKLAVPFRASPESVNAAVSAAAQAEVFSIAREALTNVRKHARANRVSLGLTVEGDSLVLRIADDGVGFEAELLAAGPESWPHFGLAGMRERAESIGGGIVFRSRPGEGTQIELHVPVGVESRTDGLQGIAPPGGTGGHLAPHQAVRSSAATSAEAN